MSEKKKPQEMPSDWQLYRRLLGYVKPYWLFFAVHIVGFAAYSGSNVGAAKFLQLIIDSLTEVANTPLWQIVAIILGLSVARGGGLMVGNYFLAYVSQHVVHDLRCQLFKHMLTLPVAYFESQSIGHLIAKVTYHVNQVTEAASDALKVIVREGLSVLGLISFLFYLNWKLSLVFVAIAPIIAVVVLYAGRVFRRVSKRIQTTIGHITQIASESVQGQREIRIFGSQAYENKRFHTQSDYNCRQALKMVAVKSASTAVLLLIVSSAMAVLICFAFQAAQNNEFSAGEFAAFFTTAGLLAKPLRQLSEVHGLIQKGLAAAQDMFALLDESAEKDQGQQTIELASGDLRFQNVSFAYEGNTQVLKNIDVEVKPGETIALVGSSGSGKSTLVSLIPRFYSDYEGQISLDGVEIQQYQLADLRRQIALVSQQVVLFNDTIFNNIAYGYEGQLDRQRVIDAAKAAHAMEFIEQLPQGIDTLIGDNGVLLSGGQRQRIAIARAILKNAPILILDEATSALDTESEQHIQQALDSLLKTCTAFVIAHRLSTIENADRILVLEKGKIVEQGTHDELLALDKRYAQLYQMQFKDKEIG